MSESRLDQLKGRFENSEKPTAHSLNPKTKELPRKAEIFRLDINQTPGSHP